MNIKQLCILATISFAPHMHGMNQEQHVPSFPEILSFATKQPIPLNTEQIIIFKQAICQVPARSLFDLDIPEQETEEQKEQRLATTQKVNALETLAIIKGHPEGLDTPALTLLKAVEQPAYVKMLSEGIHNQTEQAAEVFSQLYKESWAGRTALAAATCCFASLIKKCLPGYFDAIPTEDATLFLTGVWVAECKERKPQRMHIANGRRILQIIENANNTLVQENIIAMQALRQRNVSAQEQSKQSNANNNNNDNNTEIEEIKKNQ